LLVKTHPVATFIQISHSVSQSNNHGVTVKEATVVFSTNKPTYYNYIKSE